MSQQKQKLSKRDKIEKYVRQKNRVYLKWRIKWDHDELETFCAECLLRYGALPNWEEYVQARRQRDWQYSAVIHKSHADWKNTVREWAMERGVITYRNQSAQFVKYYFAWYRWQWEERHGVITRTYGRQMS